MSITAMQTATRIAIGLLQAMRHARQARRAPRVAAIGLRVGIGLLKRVGIGLLKTVRQARRAARAVRAPRCRRRRV